MNRLRILCAPEVRYNEKMSQNKVFLNDKGIIEIIVHGDQTVSSVQAMGDEARRLGARQRLAGKPALVLDNLLHMGNVPVAARKRVVELVRSSDYDRLAMLGSDMLLKIGANLMLQATGRGKYVRYFEDRAAAERWLMR